MPSFGEVLKRERELRQISLREVSEATKVNLRYLEALERNDFRHLPGGVFNKGFVRAYSQFIGVDPEAMINAYLLEQQAQTGREANEETGVLRGSQGAAGEPESESAQRPERRRTWMLYAAAAIAVLVVAVIAATIAFWPTPDSANEAAAGPSTETAGVGREPAVSPEPVDDDSRPDPGPEDRTIVTDSPPEVGATAERRDASPPGETDRVAKSPAPDPPIAGVVARIQLERETEGRINCDNRRIEILDGMAAGTELNFSCAEFLLVDAEDGGAVLLGLSGSPLSPLGPDGIPIQGHQVRPDRRQSL